ncbi:MAG: hypothetical protein WA057_00305 [Candidatus Magasanikiibacteriota bacterium]
MQPYITSNKIIKTFAETPNFFFVGPIVTTTGFKNPIYPDPRKTFSDPKRLQVILDEIEKFLKTKKIKYDLICGGATAGIQLSSPLSIQLGKPQIYVRSKPKDGGMKLAVEGAFKKGQRVILLDDATGAGMHKVDFVNNLRQVGLKIEWVIVPFSRNRYIESENEWIKKAKVKSQSFCDLNDIRKYAEKNNIMTKEASTVIGRYADDSYHWHENNEYWEYFLKYKNMKKRKSKSGI